MPAKLSRNKMNRLLLIYRRISRNLNVTTLQLAYDRPGCMACRSMTVRRDFMRRLIGMLMVVALAAGLLSQISPPATLAANPNVGYVDDAFGDSSGSPPGSAPTADKPQSKLWWNDGAWWAVMFKLDDNKY